MLYWTQTTYLSVAMISFCAVNCTSKVNERLSTHPLLTGKRRVGGRRRALGWRVTWSRCVMQIIEWRTLVEYGPESAAVMHTQGSAWLEQVLTAFHLTEPTLQRIQRALVEVIERRPSAERLLIRLLTAELAMHQYGQICSFFLIEKNNPAAAEGASITIELYLFG